MLEKMDLFFEARLDTYDDHMLCNIRGAREFYPFTARCLPGEGTPEILDLGCGTGLELQYYFPLCPGAKVTGIDLSGKMLESLRRKFPDRQLNLIRGSYFDVPFGEACFDAAVSVESLHHFTAEEKRSLYEKLWESLKPGGFFILTDYFAADEEEEAFFHKELLRLREACGITDDAFYHCDIPLTADHEIRTLRDAGFRKVEILKNWAATYIIRADK